QEAFYKTLLDKAGRTVTLVVNSRPEKVGARTIHLKPITAAQRVSLDYDRQVREARKKVDDLSGGKLAYARIRAMDHASPQRSQRDLYGVAQEKDGLVLDVRGNGGGNVHDDV